MSGGSVIETAYGSPYWDTPLVLASTYFFYSGSSPLPWLSCRFGRETISIG